MSFRVELESYHGPLDLLLHLVRKQELEIAELPLATVTQQYLDYVALLEQIDVDSIGDFLDVASTLIELKSRLVLPQHEQEVEQEVEGPKQDLVRRLLEFKKYRDAAAVLEDRGIEWRQRFARRTSDVPKRRHDPAESPLQGVELWDLVGAFGRVMRDRLEPPESATIRYDETPVHVSMQRVYAQLVSEGQVAFSRLFPVSVHKSTLIGVFLAVLELVRHRHALAEQPTPYGEILLSPGPEPLAQESSSIEATTDESS